MKKLLPSLLLALSSAAGYAQTVSFSVPVVPCNNDGVITANFTGLTPPLTVEWHTAGTTGTTIVHTGVTGMSDGLTGYSGGPLTVTVSDGTSMASNYFAGMAPLAYTFTSSAAVCPALGTLNATVSGGTAPYTYQWYDITTSGIIATGNPAALPMGQYGVIITDAAGCTYGSRYNDDTGIVEYVSFSATVTATPANCTDGTATVTAVDPAAMLPLSYHWNTGATTPGISGLSTGVYSVEIIDAMGCRATASSGSAYVPFSVFVPQTTVINVPGTTTPATCTSTDGGIALFPSGGTAPYTYSWSNGATTASQTGLSAGSYYATVTDANGCIGESSFFVGTATPITVTSSASPSLCTSPTGNASIVPAGGTPPYSTLWYTTPAQTSTTATLLPAGTYNFRVTDAAGCVQTGAVIVPPINAVTGVFTATSPLCMLSNGTIGVTPGGGAAPYTYLWSTGATTASITSLPAGSYNVRITDNMGCKSTIPFYLSSYSPVSLGLSTTDASCILSNDGSITATPFGGTPPYTYGWSTGAATPSITGVRTGHYTAQVSDASGCTAAAHTFLDYNHSNTSCYCTIEGTVYNDANSNCTQDPGEAGINHAQIYCSGGIGYTYTDATGHYSFIVPSGSYTVTETVMAHYPLSPCQLNNIPVTATAATACVHNVDFANGTIPVHNLRISGSTVVPPVPGNAHVQKVVIVNEGTLTEDTLQVRYRTDGQLLAPTSFVPGGIFAGGANLYTTTTVPSLAAGAYQEFHIYYNTPTNIPMGTVVNTRDTVGYDDPAGASWITDNTPANNVCNHPTTVVASYDPNFKEVTPKGSGVNGIIFAADSVLEYTVHFQNTGSWYAQNIVVLDTLDTDLDWTTLHPVYESAPCKVSVYAAGALRVAKFTFDNINLPPQMFDDLRSNGMFTYTVETMPGLALGTQFKNSASIYFDYNEPIKTNTTTNTLGSGAPIAVIDTKPATEGVLTVYPNPATNMMHAVVKTDNAGSALMSITDMAGKVIQHRVVTLTQGTQTITTDISQYAPGVYFVNVNTNGQVHSQKLVVIK